MIVSTHFVIIILLSIVISTVVCGIGEPCSNGAYCWMPSSNIDITQTELAGGVSRQRINMYIARGNIGSGVIPGYWIFYRRNGHPTAFLPYDGRQHPMEKFEALQFTRGALSWVKGTNGDWSRDAIVGGNYHESQEIAYVCRAVHVVNSQPNIIPGTFKPSAGKCFIYWNNQEHGYSKYEVLALNEYGRWLIYKTTNTERRD